MVVGPVREPEPMISKAGFADGLPGPGMVPKSWFTDPFQMLDQMGLGYKTSPSTLSYEVLSQMSEKNVVIASIMQTRINQVSAFTQRQMNKYSVGFKVRLKDARKKMSDGERDRAHEIEEILLHTRAGSGFGRDNLDTFVRKVTRDRLAYDQVCVEKVPTNSGRLHAFYAVPADTIRLAAPRRKKGTPLEGKAAADLPCYVQIIDGNIAAEYTRREMAFGVANPRTNLRVHGYGFSELEMLITTITSHLWAEEWNRKAFSQGSVIKGIFNVKGNIPGTQFENFKRQWMAQVSGVSNAWRTPFLNAEGIEWVPLQPSNTEMGYGQWLEYLIKVACAIYLIDPAEINFDTRGGPGQQPMFMSTNEAQQKISKDRGLQPLIRFFQNFFNEHIIPEIDPRFELWFVGLDAQSEGQAIELRLKELQSYKTLNEVRAEDDLPPMKNGDIPMNPVYTSYLGQKEMQAQQAAAGGAAGGPPGAGGAPPVPNGEEDQQAPEAFGGMFEGKNGPKPHGQVEAGVKQHLLASNNRAKAKPPPSDEDQETAAPWEFTVRASMASRRSPLTEDISKALAELDDIGLT
jgi:hypothetical protein